MDSLISIKPSLACDDVVAAYQMNQGRLFEFMNTELSLRNFSHQSNQFCVFMCLSGFSDYVSINIDHKGICPTTSLKPLFIRFEGDFNRFLRKKYDYLQNAIPDTKATTAPTRKRLRNRQLKDYPDQTAVAKYKEVRS